MTTSNTPASPPELCPDCQRPLGELPPLYKLGACVGRKGATYMTDCREHTITRLRTQLAAAQALAPGGELEAAERAVVEAAVARYELSGSHNHEFADACLALANNIDKLLALRAKAGR